MNKTIKLLNKIKTQTATWEDYSNFLMLKEKKLNKFLIYAQEITKKNFNNILKIYNPTGKFPAISITGSECALNCEHCDGKYLDGMKHILKNKDLENYLLDLYNNGGTGALISGGCEPDGSVPLLKFINIIKKIKNDTSLIINAHTGLLSEETAEKLAEAKVDIISFDINMDEEVIRDIYHLDRDREDYKVAINILQKYDLNIVPHICIGLYYGKLHKELESIKVLKEINPKLIVIIVLIPPIISKNFFERPKPSDIAKVIATIRFLFPNSEISLGCMRPRKEIKEDIEKYALQAGITRIEIPSRNTLKWFKKVNPEIKFKFISACCAIPEKYEELAKSSESDIKRYLNL
ncbi:MAG: radical SAM protein [Promethearchaeota archaeon]